MSVPMIKSWELVAKHRETYPDDYIMFELSNQQEDVLDHVVLEPGEKKDTFGDRVAREFKALFGAPLPPDCKLIPYGIADD